MNDSYDDSLVPARCEVFPFEGDEFHVVRLVDGDIGVVLRRLCESVGVDSDGQAQRLARARTSGAKWATTFIIQVVAADGKVRPMEVLPRRSIPFWAATLDITRVREDARPRVAAYQDRAADVLAFAFLGIRPSGIVPTNQVAPEWSEEGMRLRRAEAAKATAVALAPFVSPEVVAVVMAHGNAPLLGLPVAKLLPALPDGQWKRPTEIAQELGVTANAVGRAISALALRGDAEHCKTIMDEKKNSAGQVPCYLYDQHAVERIREHLAAKGKAA